MWRTPDSAERVDNGVDHRTKRGCCTAFAAGTHTEPIRRCGHFAERGGQKWQRVGPRYLVIHEAHSQQLPILRLVIAFLEQRLADPLGNSAMRITVQDQRIDGAPDTIPQLLGNPASGAFCVWHGQCRGRLTTHLRLSSPRQRLVASPRKRSFGYARRSVDSVSL